MLCSQRTWSELPPDLAAVQYAAMLPVGATEQHGPPLGCGLDVPYKAVEWECNYRSVSAWEVERYSHLF
jgi:hypothetical protein